MENKTTVDMPVVELEGVHCYVGEDNVAYILVDDAAFGLGFVMVRKERVTKSCDTVTESCDTVSTSGDKFYTAIRWNTVNKYLRVQDCLGKDDPDVKSGDYIPEGWFYMLAMKANNAAAKKFQKKVAFEIMPSLRKHGYYSLLPEDKLVVTTKTADKDSEDFRVYAFLLSDSNVKIGCTKRFCVRIGEIERETDLTIVDIYFTPKMPYENAHLTECCCKKVFAPRRVKGEIFAVSLKEACAKIKKYTEMSIAQLPSGSPNIIADKNIN